MKTAEWTIPCLVALSLVVSPATQAAPRASDDGGDGALALAADGLGPVRAGMPVADAERALGEALVPDEPAPGADADADDRAEWEACHYVTARHLPGVGFMVAAGRIARVDVVSQAFRTVEGAGIGTPEAELKRLYPAATVEGHPYADFGHFLMVKASGGNALVFETDGKAVTAFRAGARRAVASVEGCE
jgi:hypothetical protein